MKPLEKIRVGVFAYTQFDRAMRSVDAYELDVAGVEVGCDFQIRIALFTITLGGEGDEIMDSELFVLKRINIAEY